MYSVSCVRSSPKDQWKNNLLKAKLSERGNVEIRFSFEIYFCTLFQNTYFVVFQLQRSHVIFIRATWYNIYFNASEKFSEKKS
jgi:hypothetical protein